LEKNYWLRVIRDGEQPKNAALRELYEEVSIESDSAAMLVPMKTYTERGLLLRYILFFVNLQQKPNVLPNKEIYRYEWLRLSTDNELSNHAKQALKAYNRVHLLK
jgi:8-oxo-dGTP pyrophosphatase MutT (NUDIX family)